ncbi:c-type cytochrome [Psychrobacter sp. DM8]|uniref:c-type cytochrome n=1 Tax=Psychrobacter sp. DM8 TaxID=3440636 RepID=UPI003F4F4CAD
MPFVIRAMSAATLALLFLIGCQPAPPADSRAPVTLPLYTQGDAVAGALIYKEACAQCHQLTPGLNKKGPQLMNVYGAKAAMLADYDYSEALRKSDWVWDADTLDPYIADAEKAMPGSKMLADPMPDSKERADVIAYVSTLRASATSSNATDADATESVDTDNVEQSADDGVDVLEGAQHKPAADFG